VIYEAIFESRVRRPPRSSIPSSRRKLDRILDKALEKDRNLRYQTATELKTD